MPNFEGNAQDEAPRRVSLMNQLTYSFSFNGSLRNSIQDTARAVSDSSVVPPILEVIRINAVALLDESLNFGFLPRDEISPLTQDAWSLFQVVLGENFLEKSHRATNSKTPFPERLYGKLLDHIVETTDSPEQLVDKVYAILKYRASTFSKEDWDIVIKGLVGLEYFTPGCRFNLKLERFHGFKNEQFYCSLLDACTDYNDHMSLAVFAASKLKVRIWGYDSFVTLTGHLSIESIGMLNFINNRISRRCMLSHEKIREMRPD